MNGQRDQPNDTGHDGVPVEDAVVHAHLEVCPQRLEEVTVDKRDAADYIAQRRAEKDGEQSTGAEEDDVKKSLPHRIINVGAKFNAHAAQNQQPQDDHQRKIKSAEA